MIYGHRTRAFIVLKHVVTTLILLEHSGEELKDLRCYLLLTHKLVQDDWKNGI